METVSLQQPKAKGYHDHRFVAAACPKVPDEPNRHPKGRGLVCAAKIFHDLPAEELLDGERQPKVNSE